MYRGVVPDVHVLRSCLYVNFLQDRVKAYCQQCGCSAFRFSTRCPFAGFVLPQWQICQLV